MLIEAEVVVYVILRADTQPGGRAVVNYVGVAANLDEAKRRADKDFGPIQSWNWSKANMMVGVRPVGKSAIWIKEEML